LTEKMVGKTDIVICAGGSGSRLGAAVPKAFVLLHDTPLFIWATRTCISHQLIGTVIIVVAADMLAHTRQLLQEHCTENERERIYVCSGGAERMDSVYNGVLQAQSEFVLVHDAARPFVKQQTISNVIAGLRNHKCVIAAMPMIDTVRQINSELLCTKTLDRQQLIRVSTPQGFVRNDLLKAYASLKTTSHRDITDEASIMEKAGYAIHVVWDDTTNFKVTTPTDLHLAHALARYTPPPR